MLLIINADDFGLDERTNRGVIQSFKKGLCSSTSLMPNMPGFKEACQLAHENGLLKHVGMHLVLRDGYPLTEKIKYFPKFCNCKGQLSFSKTSPILYLRSAEKRVLAEEIRAQIRRCRSYGIPLTHIDSHYHIHTVWEVVSILMPIARQEGIPYLRIIENCGVDLPFDRKIHNYIFNYRLKVAGFARTRYFGHLRQVIFLKERLNSLDVLESLEIAIHPRINDKQMLVNMVYSTEDELEAQIREIDSYKDGVSFCGAKYLYVP